MKTTRTYYTCDRCGVEMDLPEELVFEGAYRLQARITSHNDHRRVGELADLCTACFGEMVVGAGEYFERLNDGKEK